MADGPPGGPVAATDGTATHLEELQFALGEGPSLDAYRIGQPVLAPHLAAETSWPVFSPAVPPGWRGALWGSAGLGNGQSPPDELHETLAGDKGGVPWVVHQATGALAGELSVSLAEALVRRRAHAYATDRPIGEVAGEVLVGRLDLDDAD